MMRDTMQNVAKCSSANRRYRSILHIGAMLLVSFSGASAAAQEQFPDRFMFRGGVLLFNDIDTFVRADLENAPIGTTVDASALLGTEPNRTEPRADILFRITDKHAIGASWLKFSETGDRSPAEDITVGGQTFTTGTAVNSTISTSLTKIYYQYSLFRSPEAEIAWNIGAYRAHAKFELTRPDGTGVTENMIGPLPIIGISNTYNFLPRFSWIMNYDVFFLNTSNLGGGMQNLLFGLEYRLVKHLALGAAYYRFDAIISDKGGNVDKTLTSDFNAGYGYAALYF